MIRTTATAAILCFGVATSASAALLDFQILGLGDVGSPTADIPRASLISEGESLFVGAGPYGPRSICAYTPTEGDKGTCANDLEIVFDDPIKNLTFDQGRWNEGDLIDITALLDGEVVGTYTIDSEEKKVDLSAIGPITSLVFDDQSEVSGVAYANFKFDVMSVPLPAGLALMLGGLGFLGAVRRRQ
ncbi:MAG: VPLPA-CTERM sorting domain-containing protein [Pseudomonadota bacterium]